MEARCEVQNAVPDGLLMPDRRSVVGPKVSAASRCGMYFVGWGRPASCLAFLFVVCSGVWYLFGFNHAEMTIREGRNTSHARKVDVLINPWKENTFPFVAPRDANQP